MKVHFSGVDFSSSSGPNTFANRLARQLSLMGHVIADAHDYDVALAFIEPSTPLFSDKPIVLRLDGIWFKNEHEFRTKNVGIKACYDRAHHVIFQSDFDAKMVSTHWGAPPRSSVIRNGIDLRHVQVTSETLLELKQRYTHVFVSSASWHPQKRLKTNIELFKHLRKTQFPYSCLIIMGPHPDVEVADANIYYTGAMPHQLCLEVFRTADWMLHTAYLDHSPNTVVEALSQGCPVICSSSGGTKELVGNNGIILNEQEEYHYQLCDYDNPPHIDVTQVNNLPKLKVNSSTLDIREVARQYEQVLMSVCNQTPI